jgi:PAS domain S-box-containing protein
VTGYLEANLRRAERDLVRFFEMSPDLFCIAGFDGYFRRVNANFTRVLGHPAAELVSRPYLDFVHPDDRASTRVEIDRVAHGLPVARFRNRYRDARGNYRWFDWTSRSFEDEGLVYAVARDVTDYLDTPDRG